MQGEVIIIFASINFVALNIQSMSRLLKGCALTLVIVFLLNSRYFNSKDPYDVPVKKNDTWSESKIVSFMQANPQRAYFSRLFRDGGFRTGIEVGTAMGRYSEHFLKELSNIQDWSWTIVEPFPLDSFKERISHKWRAAGLLENGKVIFKQHKSLDKELLDVLPDGYFDFIYLDGSHSFDTVRSEIFLFWEKVKPGGILAGHDYCNHGEKPLSCGGCAVIPLCQKYTEYGIANGRNAEIIAVNQHDVVMAVQDWLVKVNDPRLKLHVTTEDFTKESLLHDGMDYDLIITSTRNPSWFVVKPLM